MALKGLRVIEMEGLAIAPFCGKILADFGANVTKVEGSPTKSKHLLIPDDTLSRGKKSVSVDLKSQEAVDVVRKLCVSADVLIDPFRIGVMEKLGLGPEILLQDNPKLVYARIKGFGQNGQWAMKTGHDINFLVVSGVLSQLGRSHEKPYSPFVLMAFASGGLMCALGIMMVLHEKQRSGLGQVIDANMVNGSAYVSSFLWTSRGMPIWRSGRGENILDGGAGFYDTYETKDGKYMSVGALEPKFYSNLLIGLGVTIEDMPQMSDQHVMSDRFTQIFKTKTRDEWTEIFKDLDACVFPALEKDEASSHPFNVDNEIFLQQSDGNVEPAPAPKLSRTGPVTELLPLPNVGQHTIEELRNAGFSQDRIDKLIENQIVFQSSETS